eukprot:535971_1
MAPMFLVVLLLLSRSVLAYHHGIESFLYNEEDMVPVHNFDGNNNFLRAVASISYGKLFRWAPHCSGSLIEPIKQSKQFVLTAAHCLYDFDKKQFYPKKSLQVELGLTRGSDGKIFYAKETPAVKCHVTDMYISKKYQTTGQVRYDYGLVKLDYCGGATHGPHPLSYFPHFKIDTWIKKKKQNDMLGYKRSGFGGGRRLHWYYTNRVRHDRTKRLLNQANGNELKGCIIIRGLGNGGDSGGPIFNDGHHNYHQVAVYSGSQHRKTGWFTSQHVFDYGIKINTEVHGTIDGMMSRTKRRAWIHSNA